MTERQQFRCQVFGLIFDGRNQVSSHHNNSVSCLGPYSQGNQLNINITSQGVETLRSSGTNNSSLVKQVTVSQFLVRGIFAINVID